MEASSESNPGSLKGGRLLAAISTSIVAILREHYGRGPMKAKTYALDDTEDRRAQAIRTFAAFPEARTTRAEFPSTQRLNLEGLLGRAASSSYLPQTGNANKAMVADLRGLFALCAEDGFITFAMTTSVITADFGVA